MDPREIQARLRRFTRSENYHRHPAFSYTDGVKFLADEAGAYWLLDAIASWQKRTRRDRELRELQIWELRVTRRLNSGVLTCSRHVKDPIFSQRIPLTDFPLPYVKLHLENGVLRLPWEE